MASNLAWAERRLDPETGRMLTRSAFHKRAAKLLPLGQCNRCTAKAVHRHHKDEDWSNNSLDNLEPLCRKCHQVIEHDLGGRLKKYQFQVRPDTPTHCIHCGKYAKHKIAGKRCITCYSYWKRTGKDRPESLLRKSGDIHGQTQTV